MDLTIGLIALAAAPVAFLALSRLHGALQRPPERATVAATSCGRKPGRGAS